MIDNAVKAVVNLGISESNNFDSMRFYSSASLRVVLGFIGFVMGVAVYFNRKPCLRAIKIQDKLIDTVLSAEFIFFQLPAF